MTICVSSFRASFLYLIYKNSQKISSRFKPLENSLKKCMNKANIAVHVVEKSTSAAVALGDGDKSRQDKHYLPTSDASDPADAFLMRDRD